MSYCRLSSEIGLSLLDGGVEAAALTEHGERLSRAGLPIGEYRTVEAPENTRNAVRDKAVHVTLLGLLAVDIIILALH